ncbi:uncharacterized protein N7515_000784 [Penicillium bovifimosum]|uniref:Uncharacterized protein n=1 Tax=Penicillium bovifimosum TaxID=126998 RepID=A0A9W9HI20_9EURO|nr:uncharacterized protein N7515_000784 [Penicillium bovifimosum]KAJ5146220.1 hypothetical protein N7515_000784 [Penicillium bovifimosum]
MSISHNIPLTVDALRVNPQLRLLPNVEGGRQYNLPSVNAEVAALIIPSEFGQRGYRDIQLYLREAPSLTRATDLISVDGDNSDSDMIENPAQVTPALVESSG